ncbi:hypothetical protein [Limnobaculum parvum]|uniref:Uncharacterized protein n=1 Tax=Limnobaculum parvum TaxID=2172103 RepID=A0A2Y9TW94_9GAMM|nr:hypothetical protein [Limnobaculum parvum]AWH87779.1 hypothetical protein HYN51_03900 [Limnobaculum parvum]
MTIKKMTPYIFILIFLYMTTAFFILGVAVRIVTAFIYTAEFHLSFDGVIKVIKISVAAGALISLGALIFNIIDLRESRKKQTKSKDGE